MEIDTAFATSRVIAELSGVLTPEQRIEAAERIEALPGDETQRRFYRTTADALRAFTE